MTNEQIRKLSQDSKFLKILEVSISKTASAVMLEDASANYQPTGIVKRHTEAEKAINNLQDERKKFAILIAGTDEVNSLITIDNDGNFIWPSSPSVQANLDSAFGVACSANFNIIAGLTYSETLAP